jgi:hypothetical protein
MWTPKEKDKRWRPSEADIKILKEYFASVQNWMKKYKPSEVNVKW